MILSHRHRLIFLKSRKTAGTSFEIALSKYVGQDEIITPVVAEDETIRRSIGGRGPQNYHYRWSEFLKRKDWPRLSRALLRRERPKKFFNHIAAKAVRHRVGEAVWQDYLKVSLVRNPWDMVISWFFWDRGREADLAKLTEWALSRADALNMNRQFYHIDNRPVVDHFLRYEHLEPDMEHLEARIPALAGLQQRFRGIRAKGGIRSSGNRDQAHAYAKYTRRFAEAELKRGWHAARASAGRAAYRFPPPARLKTLADPADRAVCRAPTRNRCITGNGVPAPGLRARPAGWRGACGRPACGRPEDRDHRLQHPFHLKSPKHDNPSKIAIHPVQPIAAAFPDSAGLGRRPQQGKSHGASHPVLRMCRWLGNGDARLLFSNGHGVRVRRG